MRFESLRLQNFRGFASIELSFRPGFNVIAGSNGSGKTTLLRALAESLCDVSSYFQPRRSHNPPPLSDRGVIRVEAEKRTTGYRFEPRFPVELHASCVIAESPFQWSYVLTAQQQQAAWSGQLPGAYLQQLRSRDLSDFVWPVLAFYRAYRRWRPTPVNELAAATQRVSRGDAYDMWWEAAEGSADLEAWVISKCLERFQVSSETGLNFGSITGDELGAVNVALAQIVEGSVGLKYDMYAKALFIEWEDPTRSPTQFDNLSDGQRAVIYLATDIARRACMANPDLGQDACARTPGIILIDEIDVHLHPRWQRIIVNGLKKAFPKMQFIATTHSPQVLGELTNDEVLLIDKDSARHPVVTYGLDSSSVLEEIMGASQRSESVTKAISAVFSALEGEDLSIAQDRLAYLEKVAPGIPELAGAKALLTRKQVLKR